MTQTSVPRYASPVDYDSYGTYGPGRGFNKGSSFQRPVYRFQGRITADGSSGYPAVAGRYHLYISWGCPWAQRTAIVRRLKGLEDVISMGLCGPVHDRRSWTFDLDPGGMDPVLGIPRLQDAYLARFPDYPKGITVPAVVHAFSPTIDQSAVFSSPNHERWPPTILFSRPFALRM